MSRPAPPLGPADGVSARGRARRGFSLIEILVVIGLIAFLSAAIVAVVPRVANAAKTAATRATIKKVDEMLERSHQRLSPLDPETRSDCGKRPCLLYVSPGILASSRQQHSGGEGYRRQAALSAELSADVFRAAADDSKCRSPRHVARPRDRQCRVPLLDSHEGQRVDTEPPRRQPTSKRSKRPTLSGDGIPEIVDGWGAALRFSAGRRDSSAGRIFLNEYQRLAPESGCDRRGRAAAGRRPAPLCTHSTKSVDPGDGRRDAPSFAAGMGREHSVRAWCKGCFPVTLLTLRAATRSSISASWPEPRTTRRLSPARRLSATA